VRDLISSLGFNNSVNDYYGFVLDQVVSFIPEQKVAMFIPGAKHQLFNLIIGGNSAWKKICEFLSFAENY